MQTLCPIYHKQTHQITYTARSVCIHVYVLSPTHIVTAWFLVNKVALGYMSTM